MMFDEKLNAAVFAAAPYTSRTGRDTTNATDGIFQPSMLMKTVRDGAGYQGAIIFSADSDSDGT
jgi:hypothetical protein